MPASAKHQVIKKKNIKVEHNSHLLNLESSSERQVRPETRGARSKDADGFQESRGLPEPTSDDYQLQSSTRHHITTCKADDSDIPDQFASDDLLQQHFEQHYAANESDCSEDDEEECEEDDGQRIPRRALAREAAVNMVNYETFESSCSEDDQEYEDGQQPNHLIFESEAISYEGKLNPQSSVEHEQKRLERLKRKQRKLKEKITALEADERLKRKRLTKKFKCGNEDSAELLQFNDSVRESVIGYLEDRNLKRVDTPTRLLNNSNDFLPLESIEIDLQPKKTNEEPILTPRREFNGLKQKLEQMYDASR